MCDRCDENFLRIRDGIIEEELDGIIHFEVIEFGGWTCDGSGEVRRRFPRNYNRNGIFWNVYILNHGYSEERDEVVLESRLEGNRMIFRINSSNSWDFAPSPDTHKWSYRIEDLYYSFTRLTRQGRGSLNRQLILCIGTIGEESPAAVRRQHLIEWG